MKIINLKIFPVDQKRSWCRWPQCESYFRSRCYTLSAPDICCCKIRPHSGSRAVAIRTSVPRVASSAPGNNHVRSARRHDRGAQAQRSPLGPPLPWRGCVGRSWRRSRGRSATRPDPTGCRCGESRRCPGRGRWCALQSRCGGCNPKQ